MSDHLLVLNTVPCFFGQLGTRLNVDTPLTNQQSWNHRNLFKAVDPFLFGSPNELDAVRLQRARVDGVIIQLIGRISLIDPWSSWAGIPSLCVPLSLGSGYRHLILWLEDPKSKIHSSARSKR